MDTLGITLFRVVAGMGVLLIILLVTGRRQMSEFSSFDFLTSITIGAVAGAVIVDHRIELVSSLIALLALGGMQLFFGWLSIKVRPVNHKLNFKPIVLVEDGQIIKQNLRRVRMPVETLLQLLREKDVFDITIVELAILEPYGRLSVLKKAEHLPLTPSQVNFAVSSNRILVPVILEGKLQENALVEMGFSQRQIEEFRSQYQDSIHNVFIAFMDQNKQLHVVNDDARGKSAFLH
ncbi:DUF421 domain-containing protein [Sporomusa acidovorans]|uniref:DUF421 domain-containing protein n=1 Tax=Sporomusa acidovorans (strain ATCC 49682 / DSM 3132 / Mol) TaxID=1123286 RepID=A0ABZ3IXM1_SPOA4|nr:DUF421 domain-containing protein [Sporomusa acidovorans]OZC13892.1 hypothetical protein SPACI_54880 [Sporomusa acidovorans DSM 3132]SDF49010.1 Uncharacterized membrane protein YcaP, DUF421 family [Sporomusa acidovorans]